MIKSKTIEIFQYFALFVMFSVGAIVFQHTADNFNRFITVVFLAIGYVSWGFWHHASKSRLTKEVIAEYILVATIGVLLLAFGLGIFRYF